MKKSPFFKKYSTSLLLLCLALLLCCCRTPLEVESGVQGGLSDPWLDSSAGLEQPESHPGKGSDSTDDRQSPSSEDKTSLSPVSPSAEPSPTPTPTPTPTHTPKPTPTPDPFEPFSLAFTGDICFAENYKIHQNYVNKGFTSVADCFSEALLARMKAADLLVVNCESTVSDRGSALVGKNFTFRTSTKTAGWFKEIGADLIGLANNHVYDFGKTAFTDTLDTFNKMDLPTFGGGKKAAEAYEPFYFEKSGMKIALIAASRAEKQYYTIVAEEDAPGIAGCYDPKMICDTIKEAKQQADFVIVYVHFGYEYTTIIEDAQRETAYKFIDAGADAIVGHHAHILQGIEEYKGKPIFYSLGNFLFNTRNQETALLELTFEDENTPVWRIIPCRQKDCRVVDKLDTEEGATTLQMLRDLSPGIAIDRSGVVYLPEV